MSARGDGGACLPRRLGSQRGRAPVLGGNSREPSEPVPGGLQPLPPPRGPGWLAGAIVTWRGHLTKLLTTPYERQEGWQLAASRFQGTLYLSEVETPAARAQRLARPPLLRELMYMGYKFEQYMCAGESCPCSAVPAPPRPQRLRAPTLLLLLSVQTNLEAPPTPLGRLTPTWPSALCYAAAWEATLCSSRGRWTAQTPRPPLRSPPPAMWSSRPPRRCTARANGGASTGSGGVGGGQG